MNPDIMKDLFPVEMRRLANGKCPFCARKQGDFRDDLSFREYQISGLCQACQDETFGADPEDQNV